MNEILIDPVAMMDGTKLELVTEGRTLTILFSSQQALQTFLELLKVWNRPAQAVPVPEKRRAAHVSAR